MLKRGLRWWVFEIGGMMVWMGDFVCSMRCANMSALAATAKIFTYSCDGYGGFDVGDGTYSPLECSTDKK